MNLVLQLWKEIKVEVTYLIKELFLETPCPQYLTRQQTYLLSIYMQVYVPTMLAIAILMYESLVKFYMYIKYEV